MKKKEQLQELMKRLNLSLAVYGLELEFSFNLSSKSINIEVLENVQAIPSLFIMKASLIAGYPLVYWNGVHIVLTFHPFLYDE